MERDLRVIRGNEPSFPTQAAFGHGVYPSNRNQMKTACFRDASVLYYSAAFRANSNPTVWISLILLTGFWIGPSFPTVKGALRSLLCMCERVLVLWGVYGSSMSGSFGNPVFGPLHTVTTLGESLTAV